MNSLKLINFGSRIYPFFPILRISLESYFQNEVQRLLLILKCTTMQQGKAILVDQGGYWDILWQIPQ